MRTIANPGEGGKNNLISRVTMLYEMLFSTKFMLSKSKKSQAKDPVKYDPYTEERTKEKKKQSRESVPEEAQLLDLLDKEFKTNYYYMRNLYVGQEATVRARCGTMFWFQIGKGIYCQPAYLNSMQSTSHRMPGCMNHKLESRLPGEISTTSDMQMIPL